MEVTLLRANIDNAKELHSMQVEAFKELLEKYQDFDTSPANENMEKVCDLLEYLSQRGHFNEMFCDVVG